MDGSVVTIYLNTVAGSSVTKTLSFDGNDGDFILGQWIYGYFLDGLIDEARVYNRALSPAEILQNYEAQASKYTP